MSLKTNFPNVTTIYIQRDKRALLNSILRKNSSYDDKINRIIAIEPELKNAEICDYVIEFDNYSDAVSQLRKILGV
jgi:guanylate kinase